MTKQPVGGVHPETAAMRNALAAFGTAHSEAMLFGVGGGLGAGYILWEFAAHNVKTLVLGFSYLWNYTDRFLLGLAQRLNVNISVLESGGRKAAAENLRTALRQPNQSAIAWLDKASMPYLQLPETSKGHMLHFVRAYAMDDASVWIDDLAQKPFIVSVDAFNEARARMATYKNRLVVVESGSQIEDLPAAVRAGIQDCVNYLGQKSDSFALPSIRKWAKTMTDAKGAKGWLKLFEDTRSLYGMLKSIYEGIELDGTGGGALRGLYADFLTEAVPLLNNAALNDVAALYRQLGTDWTALADAALADDPFAETKQLMREKNRLLMQHGYEADAQVRPITDKLQALHADLNKNFPMDSAWISAHFAALQERLMKLYEDEQAALKALSEAIPA